MPIITAIVAIWLVISPVLLVFSLNAVWNSVIAGILVAVLSFVKGLGRGRFYGVTAIGAYLVVASFAFSGAARWSFLVSGILVVVIGVLGLQRRDPIVASADAEGHDEAAVTRRGERPTDT